MGAGAIEPETAVVCMARIEFQNFQDDELKLHSIGSLNTVSQTYDVCRYELVSK